MGFYATVERFADAPSSDSMDQIIDYARTGDLKDDEIAFLASSLARSGRTLKCREQQKCADIASTGGPSSLSTILCPLFLRLMEFRIPKLGVPGRPAGGIDVLAQVPGYRVQLDDREVEEALDRCGYAHFLAQGQFAPRDGQLFAHRKLRNAVNVPELAIASLLSKKIAAGVTHVGLDVRVAPHANFGASWDEATENAKRFNRVAKLVGIQSVCFLTDARLPYQPFIGRGEALLAVADLLADNANAWLLQHYRQCFAMAKTIGGKEMTLPSTGRLLPPLQSNLEAQGSGIASFMGAVSTVREQRRFELLAAKEGFLTIDLERLRATLVQAQVASQAQSPFPDPSGVVLTSQTGAYVAHGESLATVRCTETEWPETELALRRAFVLSENPGQLAGFEEVVDA